MPPKKINKKKELIQQKKIIASKLLKISLKLDDYIYKNSPISIQEAKTYEKEIAQLKLKCTDIRSLQVSEKLTSIVKSIISEQSSNDVTNVEDTTTPLPVSEDKDNKKNTACDHTINNENVPQLAKGHEINETALNLNTLQDVDNRVTDSNGILAKNNIVTPINNVSKDIQNEQIAIEKNDSINLHKMDVNLNLPIEEKTKNNNLKGSIKKKINTSSIIKNTNNKINKPIHNKIPLEIKHEEIKNNLIPKKSSVSKTKKKMATKIKCPNKALNEKVNKNNTRATKTKKEIVDLSWIENIKYIREVNADELIVTNLQESFWSNLTMPADPNFDFDAEFNT